MLGKVGVNMTKQEALDFYLSYQKKLEAYGHMMSTVYFDTATVAPKEGIAYRNSLMESIMQDVIAYQLDPKNLETLDEISKEFTFDEPYNTSFKIFYEDLVKQRDVPHELLLKQSNAINEGERVWALAKEKQDYNMFKDVLKEVVESTKEVYGYYPGDKSIYENALNDYEPGVTQEVYDKFFDAIKTDLIPFIKEVTAKKGFISDAPLHKHASKESQEKFSKELEKYFLVDAGVCYLGESVHPFTIGMSPRDARITTNYHEDNVMSSVFSFIHEYGHAQYELQVDPSLYGLSSGSIRALGMHESQSRLLENHVGRNEAFWEAMYPKFIEIFKDELGEISFDDFMKMIHMSEASYIRIEADELTYPLHVLIRYELEKEFMNEGKVDYDNLQNRWADKYEEYLGVRPRNDEEGILQDMHWGAGNLGYFPTYAYGSAIAAQFFHQMEKDFDVSEALRTSNYALVRDWLKDNIHKYGSSLSTNEILLKATGEEFNPQYYINYLKETYSKYYEI